MFIVCFLLVCIPALLQAESRGKLLSRTLDADTVLDSLRVYNRRFVISAESVVVIVHRGYIRLF